MAQAQIGPIVMWGEPPFADVPSGEGSYIMLSAGGDPGNSNGGHTLAISASGRTLAAFGGNGNCQLGMTCSGCPSNPPTNVVCPPDGIGSMQLRAVSAGVHHSLVIQYRPETQDDWRVHAWGLNHKNQASPPTGLRAKVVSAGEIASGAVDLNGKLVTWGDPAFNVPAGANDRDWVSIAVGNTFVLALDAQGGMLAWGSDQYGQPVAAANSIAGSVKIASIMAGDSHWLAVTYAGEVLHGGHSLFGQNLVPTGTAHSVSTGDWHCFAWRNPADSGALLAWGRNTNGQTSIPAGRGPFSTADGSFVHSAAIDASVCYANCDGSTTLPILDANDFICFSNRFSYGDPYANCDGSTTPPVLTATDFTCFTIKYACGCEYVGTPTPPPSPCGP